MPHWDLVEETKLDAYARVEANIRQEDGTFQWRRLMESALEQAARMAVIARAVPNYLSEKNLSRSCLSRRWNRHGKYTGAKLRAIRAEKGVGRPIFT